MADNKAESLRIESTCQRLRSYQVAEQEFNPKSDSKVSVPSGDHNISSVDDNSIRYLREAICRIRFSKASEAEFLDGLTGYVDG